MSKKTIKTDRAPAAIGPYSQAVVSGNLLFTSGQLPIDPATGKIPEGSIEDKAHIVFKNLEAIATAAGTTLDNAVKTTVYLADIAIFKPSTASMPSTSKSPIPRAVPSRCTASGCRSGSHFPV
jgi:2-iminobutanoate/2-iminopropanoate deaminase